MTEPDEKYHNIFNTYEEAMSSYLELSIEVQEEIQTPRQSHDCWIYDKVTNK
jgi:hypothetical protein